MRRAVALLAAALAARRRRRLRRGRCGTGRAERRDTRARFHPQRGPLRDLRGAGRGLLRDAGVDLTIHQPGESTDAPKLLAAGRTDFAILDIHDLGIAREQGLDLVGVMPIVQRPLAAVIARGDGRRAPPARPRGPHGRRHRPALRRSRGRLRGQRRRRRPGQGRRGDDRLQRRLLPRRRQGRRRDRLLERRGRGPAAPGRPRPHLQGRPLRRPALPRADPHHLAQDARTTTRTSSTPSSPPPAAATPSPSSSRPRPWTTCSPPNPPSTAPNSRPSCEALLPDLHPAPFDPQVLRAWSHWDVDARPAPAPGRQSTGPSTCRAESDVPRRTLSPKGVRRGRSGSPLEQAVRPDPAVPAPAVSAARPGRPPPPRPPPASRR